MSACRACRSRCISPERLPKAVQRQLGIDIVEHDLDALADRRLRPRRCRFEVSRGPSSSSTWITL